jgi:hypothetical protein
MPMLNHGGKALQLQHAHIELSHWRMHAQYHELAMQFYTAYGTSAVRMPQTLAVAG